ncbi:MULTISPECIES: cyanophycin synthetase [unclassified Oceanispirochaeta]|uniref:cyanophycin synthetase n=1 Tax=unclassified Oceanispirochaeta TaxID=2635722 RepID=UPI000E098FD2|nr:cyanophycin synthetase [Oceanispirochaeta sp. M1]MBF9016611.1 cyanophycin synthetase [Oceanispirochaeta sp. M2]NPD73184.1 cyanophycin synthetase [Oceanispirochaeta sp. M1]RDG31281.1 cyanophycin synthetase [Oceanispirochaeta sp. M1]
MIEIQELRALRGPNRHTRHTAIFMALNIRDYEEQPSNKIDGFADRLLELIPTLYNHKCSIGKPGGFIQRLHSGTYAGHIIEHIAIELQCLSGMEVQYGKTLDTTQKGIYLVVFRYLVESAGLMAARKAVALFEAVAEGRSFDLEQVIFELKVLREDDMLGPTTESIVEEAKSRGIPYIRLNNDSHIQLGYGSHQKRIQASITCQTSAIAVETADEKTRTKELLKKSGIPVPYGKKVSTVEDALALFNKMDTAVVIKPEIGNHGRGVSINITNADHFQKAFEATHNEHSDVIVEQFVEGFDFRLLVIDGILVAAAKREPAHVIGDGKSSIKELVQKINEDPRRGFGHEKVLTKIEINEATEEILSYKGYSSNSSPHFGEKVYLSATANISQGGTATDVTDEVSPSIRLMAQRTAKIIGLDCAGIDVLANDISLPLKESGIHVVEVNAAPGFRMHLDPTSGQSRNIAKPLVDMLFRNGYIQVPVLAVTGTNGKTTTAKLLNHILKYAGKNVGLACTTGIEIDGNPILNGDYSGPEGAQVVMRETTVDHIVLEVARGGIVRRGMGIDQVDVGIVLNIGTDHIGSDWIETQEQLSLVKSTVIEVVKKNGTSVLNADDIATMNIRDRARGNVILFSLNPKNQKIIEHIANGGTVVLTENLWVIIRNNLLDIKVCLLDEIPITFGGIVDFNISNALATVAALHGIGMPLEQIRNGIQTFYPSANQNPGRMNLFDFQKYKVLIDYGHNPDSARALSKLLPCLSQGRKIALCHGTGNRTDEQLILLGKTLAKLYEYIVLADFDPRNRPLGETCELVRKGLISEGTKEENIKIVLKSEIALDYVFSKVETGDLLVIQPDELEPIMGQILERYRNFLESFPVDEDKGK